MDTPNIEQIKLNKVIDNGNLWMDVSYHDTFEKLEEIQNKDAHIHSCYEIYLNITGDISFAVENSVYPITQGDVIITKPNEFHHCILHRDCKHEHYCMWINSSSGLSSILSFFQNRKNGEKNLILIPHEHKKKIIELFEILYKSVKDSNDAESLYALFGILTLLSKYHHNTVPALEFPKDFSEILNYIDNNYSSECNLSILAEKFFISRSTLTRQFKKYLNISPSKYIESRRMSVAKELLEQGESVQNVCSKCGFNDYSHFIALFRKKFGVTPYKYSKNCHLAPRAVLK